MQVTVTACCFSLAQSLAQGLIARWCRGEAFQQNAQVESCAAGDDGNIATLADSGDGRACCAGVIAGGAGLVRPVEIEAVMRDTGALSGSGLGGADVHELVDGDGIAADYFPTCKNGFAAQLLRERDSQSALATGGGTGDDDQRPCGFVRGRYHCL